MKHSTLKLIRKTIIVFLLLTAIAHLCIMLLYSITMNDFWHFNYFSVLDLSLFFPKIAKGPASFVIASIVMLGVIAVIFFALRAIKKSKIKIDDEQTAQ